MAKTEKFDLSEEDYYAIGIAIGTAKTLLKIRNLESHEIIGIENFLYALKQLPQRIRGIYSKLRLELGSSDYQERHMRYIEFAISDNSFEILLGGKFFNGFVGGDDYSEPGWLVTLDGYRERDCDLNFLKDEVARYLRLGADIVIEDITPLINDDWS